MNGNICKTLTEAFNFILQINKTELVSYSRWHFISDIHRVEWSYQKAQPSFQRLNYENKYRANIRK